MAFFGGSSVDLTSPGPIGSITPNTGAFTTLSASSGMTVKLSTGLTDRSITGLGSTSGFSIETSNAYVLTVGQYATRFGRGGDLGVTIRSDSAFGITSGNADGTIDTILRRDAANIFAQRNSTNAQTFRIYNTFTDSSNYERGFMRWATNVLEIGAEAAGTGTQRQLRFPLGTVTASTPLSITQTWNSAGVTFTGLQLNATDTASASGSLLMDLQVGGSSKFRVEKGSDLYVGTKFYYNEANGDLRLGSGPNHRYGFVQRAVWTYNDGVIAWNSTSNVSSGGTNVDLILARDSAGIFAQRNSTNAQAFKLYRTFTDASNYERLGFLATNTTRYTITSENAGTGSARSLEVSFYTAASDPTSTDITSGCFSVWKNSGTGIVKLWANDGGTMKSVALV